MSDFKAGGGVKFLFGSWCLTSKRRPKDLLALRSSIGFALLLTQSWETWIKHQSACVKTSISANVSKPLNDARRGRWVGT